MIKARLKCKERWRDIVVHRYWCRRIFLLMIFLFRWRAEYVTSISQNGVLLMKTWLIFSDSGDYYIAIYTYGISLSIIDGMLAEKVSKGARKLCMLLLRGNIGWGHWYQFPESECHGRRNMSQLVPSLYSQSSNCRDPMSDFEYLINFYWVFDTRESVFRRREMPSSNRIKGRERRDRIFLRWDGGDMLWSEKGISDQHSRVGDWWIIKDGWADGENLLLFIQSN